MGVSTKTYPAGVPFAADDTADVIQNDPVAIGIDVAGNDVSSARHDRTGRGREPEHRHGNGDMAAIFYKAPATTGTATFKYTVSNSPARPTWEP